ncbi:MAG: hypothetical protein R6U84_10250 [Candidatus Cloacimonadales bacterium]
MKNKMLFIMFVFSFICLYSDEVSTGSKDVIFSVKGNYLSSSYRNSSSVGYNFKSEDSKNSFEPSINLISKNPKRTSHLYLNWKGDFIDSKARYSIPDYNYEAQQMQNMQNMLINDDDVEMTQTCLKLGYKRRIHNKKSIVNYIDVSNKFDNYKSEYLVNSMLNSELKRTFLTIEFGHVFDAIENSDMYFASTRKSDITEYYLYNKVPNFEFEFYLAPYIERNTLNYSYYIDYDFEEPYKEEEKAVHQSFGLNFETRGIYNKNNLITGLRFSLINSIVFKDFWNIDEIPHDLRINYEIFANMLLDKFIFTSRINVENENVFLTGINIQRTSYSFFNELTFQLKKKIYFSLNYNFVEKKYINCNSSSLFATKMDQVPEKLLLENLYNSNIGLSLKVIY